MSGYIARENNIFKEKGRRTDDEHFAGNDTCMSASLFFK